MAKLRRKTYGTSLSISYALSILTLAAATAAVNRRRSFPDFSASFSNVSYKIYMNKISFVFLSNTIHFINKLRIML